MKRQEFFTVLIKDLRSLEASELQEVLAYYNEYLDDAGVENEEAAITELGEPAKIAAQIKATAAIRYIESKPNGGKKTFKSVWMVILSIFAAPIAIPLAMALFIVVFALFTVLFSLLFSLIVTGVALGVSGIVLLIGSIFLLFYNPLAALSVAGMSLTVLSLGVLIFIPMIKLTRLCASKLGLWIGSLLAKKSKKDTQIPYYNTPPYQQPQQQQSQPQNGTYTNAPITNNQPVQETEITENQPIQDTEPAEEAVSSQEVSE